MATIFPASPTIGQQYQGYEWNGTAWVTLGIDLTMDYATQSELNSHESDTTSVHGISNTADLATQSYVGSAISAHESDTTNIHGITDTSQLATKTYADNAATTAAAAIVDSAPSTLNTLNELAAALGDDSNFSTTITNSLSTKAPLESPTLTGTPTAPTATTGTNTTQIATTAFVQNSLLNVSNQQSNSYTLVASDINKMIEINNSSSTTLSIPLNSSVAFPIGTTITILQSGTGQVSIAGISGVTVNANPGLKLRTQWSSANIIKRGTDTWVALGDLTA